MGGRSVAVLDDPQGAGDARVRAAAKARVCLAAAEELLDHPPLLRRTERKLPAQLLLTEAERLAREALGEPSDGVEPTPALVQALLDRYDATVPRSSWLTRWQRPLAWALGIALLAALLSGAAHAASGVDKAFGKPWATSSRVAEFDPATRTKHGIEQPFFLETARQENPWAEVDLREPTWVWGFDIKARADCCWNQLAPLHVQFSLDRRVWQDIGVTETPFKRWRRWFWPRKMRYFRMTAQATTTLQLEAVELR